MVLKNDGLTAYMPEFKDKERIPNPDYFANVNQRFLITYYLLGFKHNWSWMLNKNSSFIHGN